MSDAFRDYMEAEIKVMMQDIGPAVQPGSTRFNMRAIQWIEQNAADFRMRWDSKSIRGTHEAENNYRETL